MRIRDIRIPYWPLLLGPWLCYIFGSFLNIITVALNWNQMPVLGPGGCSEAIIDLMHNCMTHASHLKIFSDWIYWPEGHHPAFASLGDMFIILYENTYDLGIALWIAFVIKDYSEDSKWD